MPAEQFLAAHSEPHTGATNKARTVTRASAIAFADRGRSGIVPFIPTSSRRAAIFELTRLIFSRWRPNVNGNAPSTRDVVMLAKKPAA
jgi:hypothetical protein